MVQNTPVFDSQDSIGYFKLISLNLTFLIKSPTPIARNMLVFTNIVGFSIQTKIIPNKRALKSTSYDKVALV